MLRLRDQAILVWGLPHSHTYFCVCWDVGVSIEIHTMALECYVLKVTHATWGKKVFLEVEENSIIVDTGNVYDIFYPKGWKAIYLFLSLHCI